MTDTAAAGDAAAPPAANGAALAPYGQNPAFARGLTAAGIRYVATRRVEGLPDRADRDHEPAHARRRVVYAGRACARVPRYPSNVYYNVSRQGQQLDEYNWIYVAPANGGGCVPIAGRDDLPHDAGDAGAST